MDKLKDSFFQVYFNMPVPRIIVRANEPEFTVIAINETYLEETDTEREANINHSIFRLFSMKKIGTEGNSILQQALSEACFTNDQLLVPEFQISAGEQSELHKWWQIELLPVAENGTKPTHLILTLRDITEQIAARQELQEAQQREQQLHEELAATNEELTATNEELAAANEELNATVEDLRESQENLQELNNELENRVHDRTIDLLLAQAELSEQHELLETIVNEVPAGICVLKGPEMRLEMVNRKLQESWQRGDGILGKALTEILPEIRDQEFPRILEEVRASGKTYTSFDAEVELLIDGHRKTGYRDYSYTPIKNKDGEVQRIVALSMDVTERSLARLREQELLEEASSVNEELSASNEELASSNEELAATNDELYESRERQQQLIAGLAESEARFRNLITEAPVAICVLKGSDYLLDAINTEGLKILGKTRDILGKSLRTTLSAQEKRPFLDLLNSTYRSGEVYYGNEVPASFEHDGLLIPGYFNFVFKPVRNDSNRVDGIIIVASKVTDLVEARKEKENAEIKLGLAIEAAKMGSWQIDGPNKDLYYNATLATLFGYEGTEPMTYDQAIAQVTDDYREKLVEEIDKAILSGGAYDMTYTQRRFNDDEIIWLRSLGKISQDALGNYSIFSGVVMDITEQKQDEQRKNDFIGMVSHELKTPLTSLNGYTQILKAKAVKNEDTFSVSALTKVIEQVKKMTAMINGFLNISRLESGKILLKKTEFNLEELITENMEEAELLAGKHQLSLQPCGPVTVSADRDKIGSVISNLISNAIKYSPDGKEIEISCEIRGQNALISVKDKGMGIGKEDLPRLFERYYRVESDQTQLISGFGIGLYLSAEIILHHQGKIWAESEPGKGSTFFFTLPLA